MMNFWISGLREFSADTRMTVTLIFDHELNQTYDKLLLEFAYKHCVTQFLWKFDLKIGLFFMNFMAENDHFQTVSIEQLWTKIAIEPIERNRQIGKHESLEGKTNHFSTQNIFVKLVV